MPHSYFTCRPLVAIFHQGCVKKASVVTRLTCPGWWLFQTTRAAESDQRPGKVCSYLFVKRTVTLTSCYGAHIILFVDCRNTSAYPFRLLILRWRQHPSDRYSKWLFDD